MYFGTEKCVAIKIDVRDLEKINKFRVDKLGFFTNILFESL